MTSNTSPFLYFWRFSEVARIGQETGGTRMADSLDRSCHNSIRTRQCHNSIRPDKDRQLNSIWWRIKLNQERRIRLNLGEGVGRTFIRGDQERTLASVLGKVHVKCMSWWWCGTVGPSKAWPDGQWQWEGGVMARRAMGLLDCCLHVQRRKESWTVLHVVKIKIEAIESTLAFLSSCWSKEKWEDE